MGLRTLDRDGAPLARRVALIMFFVGGIVAVLGSALKPDLTAGARAVQLAAGGGFLLSGVVVWLAPGRRWVIEAGAILSVILLGLIVGSSNAIGATPFFFLWPLVYLAYFGARSRVVAAFVVMAITVGIATAVNPYQLDRVDTFVGTVASVGLMALLVMVMHRRERELRDALAAAANTDALTGLLNRRGFGPALEALVAQPGDLAIVMVDLDHFKAFNDLHGHLVGDEALVRLATALTAAAGAHDRIARFGGEEFTVALPGGDAAAAAAYASAVSDRLRDEAVDDALRLTVSAGIATRGAQAATVSELLRSADTALYRAKRSGRNRAVMAQTPERPDERRRAA